MKLASATTTCQPAATFSPRPAAPPPPASEPQDSVDFGKWAGGIAGGAVLGAGLGYVGMQVGARLGMDYAMHVFPASGAAALLTIFAAGLPYMALGAGIGGAVGIASGGALGGYLGSSLAGHHRD